MLILLLAAIVAVEAADPAGLNATKASAMTPGMCEPVRQGTLGALLHAEKARTFANTIAITDSIKTKFSKLRWLPLYFEETGRFSQFFLLEGNFTGTQAFDACQKLDGAYLAVLNTQRRVDFVNKFLMYMGNYWFGLHRWDNCPVFKWSNGEMLGNSSFTWWHKDEPKSVASKENCVRAVTPDDIVCNASFCHSKSYASWVTDSCDGTDEYYGALCETNYPRPLYAHLAGKFDWKQAKDACATMFPQNPAVLGSSMAMPKTWAGVNNLVNGVNFNLRNWHCWVGLQRSYEEKHKFWKYGWVDGTWSTRFSYLPWAYETFKDDYKCGELYDGYYSTELGLGGKPAFNFNDCNAVLDCVICESYWML